MSESRRSGAGQVGRLAAVAGFALFVLTAVHVILPASWSRNESADYESFYRPVAENLLAGRGLVDADGEPADRYPPGYPLVLAVVLGLGGALGASAGAAETALVFALFAASAVGVYLLARRVWGERGSWIAVVVWTTYPPGLWLAKQPNSELLFLPLLLLTALLFFDQVGRRSPSVAGLVGVGLAAGATMLVRPAAIGVGLLLAGLYVGMRWRAGLERRLVVGAVLVLLGNAVAVAPWEIWLERQTGRLQPLSSGGVRSVADGLTFAVRDKGYRQGTWVPGPAREVMSAIAARYEAGMDGGELIALVGDQALERPLGFGLLVAVKAARSWYGTDSQRHEIALLAVQIPYLLLAALSLWSCRSGPQRRQWLALLVLALAVYFWAMSTLVASLARYTAPAYALLAVVTPAILERRRSRVSGESSGDST